MPRAAPCARGDYASRAPGLAVEQRAPGRRRGEEHHQEQCHRRRQVPDEGERHEQERKPDCLDNQREALDDRPQSQRRVAELSLGSPGRMVRRQRDRAVLQPLQEHEHLDEQAAEENDRSGEQAEQHEDRARSAEGDHGARGGRDAEDHEDRERGHYEHEALMQIVAERAAALEALPEVLRFGQDIHGGQKDNQSRPRRRRHYYRSSLNSPPRSSAVRYASRPWMRLRNSISRGRPASSPPRAAAASTGKLIWISAAVKSLPANQVERLSSASM